MVQKFKIFTALLACLVFIGCNTDKNDIDYGGREVTQQFLSEYNGTLVENTDRSSGSERLMLSRDGQVELLKIRKVGEKNNPALPEDTVCSYVLHGQVRHIVELDAENRIKTNDVGETYTSPATHEFVFSVHQVSLSDELRTDTTNDPACFNFQEKMNKKLPTYTYGMELFGSGTLRFHTSNLGDVTDPDRPEVLDEIFIRQ